MSKYEKHIIDILRFNGLIKDTTFLLNSIGVRHNSDLNKGAGAFFMDLSDEAREEWYDKAYTLYLLCKFAISGAEIMREIDSVKKQAKNVNALTGNTQQGNAG
jgi:hypothetical protein